MPINVLVVSNERELAKFEEALDAVKRSVGGVKVFRATKAVDGVSQLQAIVATAGVCHAAFLADRFTVRGKENFADTLRNLLRDKFADVPIVCFGDARRGGKLGKEYHVALAAPGGVPDPAELTDLLQRLARGQVTAEYAEHGSRRAAEDAGPAMSERGSANRSRGSLDSPRGSREGGRPSSTASGTAPDAASSATRPSPTLRRRSLDALGALADAVLNTVRRDSLGKDAEDRPSAKAVRNSLSPGTPQHTPANISTGPTTTTSVAPFGSAGLSHLHGQQTPHTDTGFVPMVGGMGRAFGGMALGTGAAGGAYSLMAGVGGTVSPGSMAATSAFAGMGPLGVAGNQGLSAGASDVGGMVPMTSRHGSMPEAYGSVHSSAMPMPPPWGGGATGSAAAGSMAPMTGFTGMTPMTGVMGQSSPLGAGGTPGVDGRLSWGAAPRSANASSLGGLLPSHGATSPMTDMGSVRAAPDSPSSGGIAIMRHLALESDDSWVGSTSPPNSGSPARLGVATAAPAPSSTSFATIGNLPSSSERPSMNRLRSMGGTTRGLSMVAAVSPLAEASSDGAATSRGAGFGSLSGCEGAEGGHSNGAMLPPATNSQALISMLSAEVMQLQQLVKEKRAREATGRA